MLFYYKPDNAITVVESKSVSENAKIFQRQGRVFMEWCTQYSEVCWYVKCCFPSSSCSLSCAVDSVEYPHNKMLGALMPFTSWRLSQLLPWFQDTGLQCTLQSWSQAQNFLRQGVLIQAQSSCLCGSSHIPRKQRFQAKSVCRSTSSFGCKEGTCEDQDYTMYCRLLLQCTLQYLTMQILYRRGAPLGTLMIQAITTRVNS